MFGVKIAFIRCYQTNFFYLLLKAPTVKQYATTAEHSTGPSDQMSYV